MRNFILFLCILTTTSLFAQETKLDFKKKDNTGDIKNVELTIDEAVSLALKNNLGLEGEKLKIEQKKLALYTSWNVFLPSMSFTATMSRMNDRDPVKVEGLAPATQITNPTSPGFPGYTVMPYSAEVNKPEFTPSFSFDLTSTFNFAMVFSIYNTTFDYKSGKISLEIAEKKLVKDIKKNFYSFLLFEENIKLMKNKVLNSEERYKQTQTLYKNGIVPELNVLQSKVANENLKPALLELENNYEIAKMSFKQTLGLKRDVNLILNGSLELPAELESFDQDELIEKYIEKRLDVQSMNLTLKTLNNVKNIGVAGLTPSFIFKFTVDPTFQYDIGDEKTWKYSTGDKKDQIMDIGDLWKQRSGMIMLGLSLPLDSWIPFSKKQTDIINADFNIKQS
nr:TolC family protein [Spirochaetota bacterium]